MYYDTFTGIVSFICKKNNKTMYKYTIINNQCPEKFKNNIAHFNKFYDLNELYWSSSLKKANEIAFETEKICPTSNGIVEIDYTKEEPIETSIMYSSEYKQLNFIKHILFYGFNIVIHIVYLLFIIKLYFNLFN
jgi:hypothetical protein